MEGGERERERVGGVELGKAWKKRRGGREGVAYREGGREMYLR